MATFSTYNENGWLGGYSADLGEYIGPWPIVAPGVMAGCTGNFSEVDFYIGLPNPSDPTTISAQFDGTYATPVWEVYRIVRSTFTGGFDVGWWTGQRGGATVPDGLTPPPAGMHLFVVVFTDGGSGEVPPAPPEAYVPASMVAGGTAAFTSGGWSAWQTGLPGSNTASASGGTNWTSSGSGGSAGASGVESASITTLAQTAIDAITAGGTAGSGTDNSQSASVSTGKTDPDIGNPSGTAGVTIVADFTTAHYAASPVNFDPTTTLTYGVDYSDAPFGAPDYQYESPYPADFAWDDLTGSISIDVTTRSGGASAATIASGMRVEILSAVPSVGSVGLTTGTVLVNVAADSTSMTSGTPYPYTQAFPTGTDPDLVISAAPVFLYSGAGSAAFPNFTGPGNLAWSMGFSIPSTLGYSWTTSRWRYWLPNPIIPATGLFWHTVGGHFATPGGATMKILTPGAGWVDVVDGPA